jgi:type II secretory pathway component GspD/PulD (secretin)
MISRDLPHKRFRAKRVIVAAVGAGVIFVFLAPGAGAGTDSGVPAGIRHRDNAVEFQAAQPRGTLETKVIPLLYAEASYILEKLDKMKSSDGVVVYNEQDRALILKDAAASVEAMSVFVKETDIFLETETLKLEHVLPERVVKTVEETLTKNVGQVKIDKLSQSVIVTDTPLKIEEIRSKILSIDHANKKVKVDVKAFQIVLNDEHIKGVDWEAIVSDYQQFPLPGVAGGPAAPGAGRLSYGIVTREDYDILLEALDTVGVVQALSEKMVEIETGTTADIDVASEPAPESRDKKGSVSGHPDSAIDDPSAEKIIFHLAPKVGRDDKWIILIEPERVSGAGGLSRKVSGEKAAVSVEDGSTLVIGGLLKEVKVAYPWKIPLLGDLPLLGFVFRNQGEATRTAETVTFFKIKTEEK